MFSFVRLRVLLISSKLWMPCFSSCWISWKRWCKSISFVFSSSIQFSSFFFSAFKSYNYQWSHWKNWIVEIKYLNMRTLFLQDSILIDNVGNLTFNLLNQSFFNLMFLLWSENVRFSLQEWKYDRNTVKSSKFFF